MKNSILRSVFLKINIQEYQMESIPDFVSNKIYMYIYICTYNIINTTWQSKAGFVTEIHFPHVNSVNSKKIIQKEKK